MKHTIAAFVSLIVEGADGYTSLCRRDEANVGNFCKKNCAARREELDRTNNHTFVHDHGDGRGVDHVADSDEIRRTRHTMKSPGGWIYP